MTAMRVCPSGVPPRGNLPGGVYLADTSSCCTYGICHCIYIEAMFSLGMFPAKGWSHWGYQSWGIPAQNGVTLWVVFAPGLPFSLVGTFSVQHCSLRPFFPHPSSSLFSDSYRYQTYITVWRLSLHIPASSLLDPPQTFP